MTDIPIHERPETQLVLWLSDKHLPNSESCEMLTGCVSSLLCNNNGDIYGLAVLVTYDSNTPEWLTPVMEYAFDNDYSLIVFTANGEVVDYLPTYGD